MNLITVNLATSICFALAEDTRLFCADEGTKPTRLGADDKVLTTRIVIRITDTLLRNDYLFLLLCQAILINVQNND